MILQRTKRRSPTDIQTQMWRETIKTELYGEIWHIVHTAAARKEEALTELVIHMQGILCRLDLPPFTSRISYVSSHQTEQS